MNAIFQKFEFIFVNTYNCLHHMKSALYTSGKKILCITKKSIKDQYQNKMY